MASTLKQPASFPQREPGRLAEPPLTSVTLLTRLKYASDVDAWREFVHLYGPVVNGFARKRGLQDADAADLMQEVLRSVARNIGKLVYDPSLGTFRGWLYTVTRNKFFNFLSAQKNQTRGSGDPSIQARLDDIIARTDDWAEDWEREYQRRLSAKAMDLIRKEFQSNSWKAFWGTAVVGRPAQDIGAELGMTTGAVYVAKSRVLARLREEVKQLQGEADGLWVGERGRGIRNRPSTEGNGCGKTLLAGSLSADRPPRENIMP